MNCLLREYCLQGGCLEGLAQEVLNFERLEDNPNVSVICDRRGCDEQQDDDKEEDSQDTSRHSRRARIATEDCCPMTGLTLQELIGRPLLDKQNGTKSRKE